MPNNSYEYFLYDDDQQVLSIFEVQKEYEQKNGDISKYETKCCVQTARKQTHKTSGVRAYLSTLPTSNHEEGCSYNYDLASNSAVKQFGNINR